MNYSETMKLATFVEAVTEKFGLTFQIPSRAIAQILGNISQSDSKKIFIPIGNQRFFDLRTPFSQRGSSI